MKIRNKGVAAINISTPLFDQIPSSHATDPITSLIAEDRVNRTGVRGKQCRQVFEALQRNPGSTSAELAYLMDVDRVMPARRLPDLEKLGFVKKGDIRHCAATGSQCVTWWPVKKLR